ncbi:MAG TPA: serpin family protein [Clostridia bacterium]|nr:serpin family protein [Clostridia bacterium]
MKKRIIAAALCLALFAVSFSGCTAAGAQSADLMKGVKANRTEEGILMPEDAVKLADFGVRLFQKSAGEGKNALLSPLSVLAALGMTENGAKGETLKQMETVFGLSVKEMNESLQAYLNALPAGEKYKLSAANSIWLKDEEGFVAEPDFLQANADIYSAGIYKTPFDEGTLKEINSWVSKHTDGMIENILDQIPADAVMYLVNALAFDAEWETIYKDTQVRDGMFTTEDGEKRDVKMMHSVEDRYLQDENAAGFLKYYADQKYAFAALLPDEGVSVSEYAASLTGEKLMSILKNAEAVTVNATMPKFESEFSTELGDTLKSMGMSDAFDAGLADFSGIGTPSNGNIFINRVLHKTYIAVDEKGTKAGAVTAVEMAEGSAMEPQETRTVVLDRPFVYLIIDCETNLPIFMGVLMDTEA